MQIHDALACTKGSMEEDKEKEKNKRRTKCSRHQMRGAGRVTESGEGDLQALKEHQSIRAFKKEKNNVLPLNEIG